MQLEPQPDNMCFGCGGANVRGLRLTFEQDDAQQRITGRFKLEESYQGGSGYLHGGIIAVLLDEVMSKVCRFYRERAVTADLRVEYLRPIRVDQEIVVTGFIDRREGRQLYHEGEIRNTEGKLLARGKARFVVIDPEKFSAVAARDHANSGTPE
jgi:uncharacterized protein (TIGR00369 family)